MPANVVKTADDEEKWQKAKKLAARQGRDEDYTYIMGIYKRLRKSAIFFTRDGRILTKASAPLKYYAKVVKPRSRLGERQYLYFYDKDEYDRYLNRNAKVKSPPSFKKSWIVRIGNKLFKAQMGFFGGASSAPGQKKKVQRPGSRGGKYYIDKQGNIVYGERPVEKPHVPMFEEEKAPKKPMTQKERELEFLKEKAKQGILPKGSAKAAFKKPTRTKKTQKKNEDKWLTGMFSPTKKQTGLFEKPEAEPEKKPEKKEEKKTQELDFEKLRSEEFLESVTKVQALDLIDKVHLPALKERVIDGRYTPRQAIEMIIDQFENVQESRKEKEKPQLSQEAQDKLKILKESEKADYTHRVNALSSSEMKPYEELVEAGLVEKLPYDRTGFQDYKLKGIEKEKEEKPEEKKTLEFDKIIRKEENVRSSKDRRVFVDRFLAEYKSYWGEPHRKAFEVPKGTSFSPPKKGTHDELNELKHKNIEKLKPEQEKAKEQKILHPALQTLIKQMQGTQPAERKDIINRFALGLAGDRNKRLRADVMTIITNKKTPTYAAGVHTLEQALENWVERHPEYIKEGEKPNLNDKTNLPKGTRVTLKNGRHGEIIDIMRMRWKPLFGEAGGDVSVSYTVRTDNGAIEAAINPDELEIEKEGQKPEKVVKDIKFEDEFGVEYKKPSHLAMNLDYFAEKEQRYRKLKERARKPERIKGWEKAEARNRELKEKAGQALQKWAAEYPEEAKKELPEKYHYNEHDLGLIKQMNDIREKPFKSANDEKLLKIYQARVDAKPEKWKEGYGVGYRIGLPGTKQSQVNRGFQVVRIDPDKKMALVKQVADTGITVTGGADRLKPEWVHIADLVRDRKYDSGEHAAQPGESAGDFAEYNTFKHTQKGHDVHVVKLNKRVDRDKFVSLRSAAKKHGGYYSKYAQSGAIPGFHFSSEEKARKFMEELS